MCPHLEAPRGVRRLSLKPWRVARRRGAIGPRLRARSLRQRLGVALVAAVVASFTSMPPLGGIAGGIGGIGGGIGGVAVASAAETDDAVPYLAPVERDIADLFHVGQFRWSPGNRGIDYDTVPGEAVRASGVGTVVFAGQVGGSLHVVVLHADGLRTTYAFLQSILVARGDDVEQGQPVGTAAERLHFGVRAGSAYLNPLDVLARPRRVHLVPIDGVLPLVDEERRGLIDHLRGLAEPAAWFLGRTLDTAEMLTPLGQMQLGLQSIAATADAFGRVTGLEVEAFDLALISMGLTYSTLTLPSVEPLFTMSGLILRWRDAMKGCTPESEAPSSVNPHDRILVLVSGLGSSSPATPDGEEANLMGGGAFSVDWPSLGFQAKNVYRFNYTGGSTRDGGFTPEATLNGLRDPAGRLRKLLNELSATHPGQTIDVVAHSQGGLVSRAAVSTMLIPGYPSLRAHVNSLTTLSSPHQGAELADLLNGWKTSVAGNAALDVAGQLRPLNIDPTRQTMVDLDPDSDFLARVHDAALADGISFTSVGGDGDPTVTAPSTVPGVDGAHHTLLHVPGVGKDHDALPAMASTTTEIALAQAGKGPVCQKLAALVSRELEGRALRGIEDRGGTLSQLGLYAALPFPTVP